MAESTSERWSSPQSDPIPQRFMGLSGKELPTSPIPQSQTPPILPSPANTNATATKEVGDRPIAPQSPMLGGALEKHKVPNKVVRLFSAELPTKPIPESETPPIPHSATATEVVGDLPIAPQSPILGRAQEKHEVPNKNIRLFGTVIHDPAKPQSETPTDTSATSARGSVANQPIRAALVPAPIAHLMRRRRPRRPPRNSFRVSFRQRNGLWESFLSHIA